MVERGLVDDLADRDVKAARSTIDEELKRWENAGYAGRTAGGRRGSPYRFWMVTKPPTSFLRSNPFGSSEESNTDGACGAGDDPLLSSDGWNVYSEGNDDEEDRWTA